MGLVLLLTVGLTFFGIVGLAALDRDQRGSSSSPSARGGEPDRGTAQVGVDAPKTVTEPVSTFEVLGGGVDEVGNPARRGYAFVVHSGPRSSDLLTDYHLVVSDYVQGYDKVQLRRGVQTFTAKVVAVSPDPHVALLRIDGTYPSLAISATRPAVGDSVTLGEPGSSAVTLTAAVVPHVGPGGRSHLMFSIEVGARDDGDPVLNEAGQVVGIAEPSTPFGDAGVGYAIPILAACLSVKAC